MIDYVSLEQLGCMCFLHFGTAARALFIHASYTNISSLLDTYDELNDVDQQSYNQAKQLVIDEVKNMELKQIHPSVKEKYGDIKTATSTLQQTDSIILHDIRELEKKHHDEIYNLSKQQIQIPKLDAIDLSKYTDFKTKNEDQPVDFKRIYISLAHQNQRLASLDVEADVQRKINLSSSKNTFGK